ncbi:hypothetical protein COLO4_18787 [Corchorus olitorius]|uniref:Uncharacterized protein n=1 Tax=Corchorus olitorius TaxID=93759 RepID=A0A1R3J7R0_9ROSI|nr:hypothetical protein COLO4_18787 [Corchorus olitorius]
MGLTKERFEERKKWAATKDLLALAQPPRVKAC